MSHVQDPLSSPVSGEVELSVLIVTYNSADTIEVCVKSILADSTDIQIEIIVVDNHSSDGTQTLLQNLAGDHPQLQLVLNSDNKGFAVGNNQALRQSTGTLVFILNPDTVIHKKALKGLMDALTADPQIALVAPRMQYPDGRIQKTCRRFPTHGDVIYHTLGLAQLFPTNQRLNAWKMGDFDHRSARQVDQPAGAALMLRGNVIRELEGFDLNFPMFFNDVDLCKRIRDAGYEIWFRPEFVLDHVGGASVKQARFKMTISSHVSFFRYFEKHFTRIHQQPLNFLVGVLLYLSLIPRLLLLLINRNDVGRARDTL